MVLNALTAACGVLLVAAITPGPNNLIVLRVTASGGLPAAWPAIAGIVLGGLAMLGIVVAGSESALSQWPYLRTVAATAGAAYLCWLGLRLMRPRDAEQGDAPLPTSLAGLFCFQFLNPKSWMMVVILVAAFPPLGMSATFAHLAPAFVLIPTACLLAWALAGRSLAAWIRIPAVRRKVDRAMGAALILSAILLFQPVQ